MQKLSVLAGIVGVGYAQKIGGMTPEEHLKVPIMECTVAGGCVTQSTSVVLDSNWRWLHETGCEPNCVTSDNCYTGNNWNKSICTDLDTCSTSCALDGLNEATWNATYGIRADGNGALNLSYVTKGPYSRNVGSRVYLMADDDHYKMFKLLNKEFTFTVDTSAMPCGLNGALYFVEMEEDGGKASYATNEAGAAYGTGYCDAQCPHDLKWINGEANLKGWNGSSTDPNAGTGYYGTCCAELDIWEANAISTQMTVHSCSSQGQYRCEGIECGDNPDHRFDGVCDKNGCDFNPYREGAHDFYCNSSKCTLNTLEPMTVTTQFITDDGSDTGKLVEMRRIYRQGGKVIQNPVPSYAAGTGKYTSISDEMCAVQMTNFSDHLDVFKAKGGIAGMGEAMGRGMVIVLSMWDDHDVGMIWLDAIDPYDPTSPTGINQTSPWGAARGSCSQDSGNSTVVETQHPDSYVVYSDIRVGEINSTTVSGPSPSPPSPSACPGGSLSACISICPASPPTAYQACVQECVARCKSPVQVA